MQTKPQKKHVFTNPLFVAKVVAVEDPTYSYRIKVRIPTLHDYVDDKDLPWAAKVDSSFLGVGNTDLLHSVPEVGTQVLVLAVANDPNSLVYLGSLYTKQSDTPTGDKYQNTYGIYTKAGEFIGVEKLQGVFHMIWNGDLTFDVQGKIKIGSQAQQPAPLGTDLQNLLQNMMSTFNTHTHTGNLGMPTSPSASTMVYQDILSKKVKVE